eukprot:7386829-Prymnesium_polylepis.1
MGAVWGRCAARWPGRPRVGLTHGSSWCVNDLCLPPKQRAMAAAASGRAGRASCHISTNWGGRANSQKSYRIRIFADFCAA